MYLYMKKFPNTKPLLCRTSTKNLVGSTFEYTAFTVLYILTLNLSKKKGSLLYHFNDT